MAERTATIKRISKGLLEVTYSAAASEADTFEAVDITAYGPVKGVGMAVGGSFGTGGTVQLQGAGAAAGSFSAFKDLQGTAIGVQSAGYVNAAELARYIRPHVSAGTTVSVTAILHVFLAE